MGEWGALEMLTWLKVKNVEITQELMVMQARSLSLDWGVNARLPSNSFLIQGRFLFTDFVLGRFKNYDHRPLLYYFWVKEVGSVMLDWFIGEMHPSAWIHSQVKVQRDLQADRLLEVLVTILMFKVHEKDRRVSAMTLCHFRLVHECQTSAPHTWSLATST